MAFAPFTGPTVLPGLPGCVVANGAYATGCTDDGALIVGYGTDASANSVAGYWTGAGWAGTALPPPASGADHAGGYYALGCTADGSIITGVCQSADGGASWPLKWTRSGGSYGAPTVLARPVEAPSRTRVFIGGWPSGTGYSTPGCNLDGTLLVGGFRADGGWGYCYWDSAGTVHATSVGDTASFHDAAIAQCSRDGTIAVGYAGDLTGETGVNAATAYRWTGSFATRTALPTTGGATAQAYFCSPDGAIACGVMSVDGSEGFQAPVAWIGGALVRLTYSFELGGSAAACSNSLIVGNNGNTVGTENTVWATDGTVLQNLPPLPGQVYAWANYITPGDTVITGQAVDASGNYVAVFWTSPGDSGGGGPPPSPPGNLRCGTAGPTVITPTWDAVEGAASYSLRYRVAGSGAAWVTITDITGTSRPLTGLASSTTYEWQVATDLSAWSATATCATGAPSTSGPSRALLMHPLAQFIGQRNNT